MENGFYVSIRFDGLVLSAERPAALLEMINIALKTMNDEQANSYGGYLISATHAVKEMEAIAKSLNDKEGELIPFNQVWKLGTAINKAEEEVHAACEAFKTEQESDSQAYGLLVNSMFAVFGLVYQCRQELEHLIDNPEQPANKAA